MGFEDGFCADDLRCETGDFSGGLPAGPIRNLFSALLHDGIIGYFNYVQAARPNQRLREAFTWVRTEDSEHFLSFNNVCEALGLDPAYLRRKLSSQVVRSEGAKSRRRRTR